MNELATLLSRSLPPLFQRRGILGLGEFALDALRPVKAHLEGTSSRLRRFVDAQLLISAQTLADGANALYAAAALDLPRRGVVHMSGGMGALADSLVSALKRNGGKIRYRKRVTRLHRSKGQPFILETKDGEAIQADIVIANLPSENLNALLSNTDGTHPGDLPLSEEPRWGAFSLHLGIDGALIPEPFPTHHQVIVDEPLAEGNSIFLSLSPEWDETRAPEGMRAISISTHTRLKPWWELFKENVREYENQKARYTERVIAATERILPGIREATQLTLPGTPITFQRFTGRAGGWVGGFPQRHLFSSERPRRGKRIWMVGDSIFPGQSTAAVALGGLRVAYLTLDELRVEALGPSYEMGLAAGAPPFATKRRACEI
jgi:phytoene dehydrogenase-like protein